METKEQFRKQRLTVCMKFDVDVFLMGTAQDLDLFAGPEAMAVAEIAMNADTCSDGRYDFAEELIEHGITTMLESSLFYEAPAAQLSKVYGKNCMIPCENGNGTTNKAYYMSGQHRKRCSPSIHFGSHDWNITITEADG